MLVFDYTVLATKRQTPTGIRITRLRRHDGRQLGPRSLSQRLLLRLQAEPRLTLNAKRLALLGVEHHAGSISTLKRAFVKIGLRYKR